MDWAAYCTKYWQNPTFKEIIDRSEVVFRGEGRADFDQYAVSRESDAGDGVHTIKLLLNEAELKALAKVDYIPRDMLKGPSMLARSQTTGEMETAWLYRNFFMS